MFLAEIPSLGGPNKFCFILFPIYIIFFISILFLLFWFIEFCFFPRGLYTHIHIPNQFLLT